MLYGYFKKLSIPVATVGVLAILKAVIILDQIDSKFIKIPA